MLETALRTTPTTAEVISRTLSLTLGAALLALCLAWELGLNASWFWALKALPLLPALAGLWRYRLYTYRWVCLLVWVYAAEGLVHVGSSTGVTRWLGAAEVLLAVALFTTATVHIRQRLAAAKAPRSTAHPAP
jgi:uncharacterized membrane protein